MELPGGVFPVKHLATRRDLILGYAPAAQLTPVDQIVLEVADDNLDILRFHALQNTHAIVPQDPPHLSQISYAASHHSPAHDGRERSVDGPVRHVGDSRQNARRDELLTTGVSNEVEEYDDTVRRHVRQPGSQLRELQIRQVLKLKFGLVRTKLLAR